jgi:hypothetical protein
MADATATPAAAGDGAATPTLSELDDNPEQYVDQQVTILGEVTEVNEVGPNSFRANDTQVLGGDDVLVIYRGLQTLSEEDTILMSGMLQEYDVVTVEEHLGIDLEQDLYADIEDTYVFVADTGHLVPTDE